MNQTISTPTSEPTPRFLADRTVGKLARWLRLLGYNTVYLPQLSPDGALREARRQGRILLTRDTRIRRRKDAPPLVFLEKDRFREQLAQVVQTLQLDPAEWLLTRCSECNAALQVVEKERVQDRVPAYVWQTQAEFRCCPDCRRLYWGATHKVHMLEELRRLGLLETRN